VQQFLSQKQVAYMLGVSVRTLERHRLAGLGPHFVRIGRLVRYREADVDEWALKARGTSTSTNAVQAKAPTKECRTVAVGTGAPVRDVRAPDSA
jgi:predicted DNA-binding transcriptional regulator AlpA